MARVLGKGHSRSGRRLQGPATTQTHTHSHTATLAVRCGPVRDPTGRVDRDKLRRHRPPEWSSSEPDGGAAAWAAPRTMALVGLKAWKRGEVGAEPRGAPPCRGTAGPPTQPRDERRAWTSGQCCGCRQPARLQPDPPSATYFLMASCCSAQAFGPQHPRVAKQDVLPTSQGALCCPLNWPHSSWGIHLRAARCFTTHSGLKREAGHLNPRPDVACDAGHAGMLALDETTLRPPRPENDITVLTQTPPPPRFVPMPPPPSPRVKYRIGEPDWQATCTQPNFAVR